MFNPKSNFIFENITNKKIQPSTFFCGQAAFFCSLSILLQFSRKSVAKGLDALHNHD